jgi:hypothetical protein
MKNFYVNRLGLDLVSEEKGRHVFLKAGKSMLLIFNPENTRNSTNNIFPAHDAVTPPSSIHFALETRQAESCLIQNKIVIEKEVTWGSRGKSMYFRDPVRNLVEIITKGQWPVKD